MKKIVLSLAAVASLGLVACSPEATTENTAETNEAVVDANAMEAVEDVNAAAAADENAMDAAMDNAGNATEEAGNAM